LDLFPESGIGDVVDIERARFAFSSENSGAHHPFGGCCISEAFDIVEPSDEYRDVRAVEGDDKGEFGTREGRDGDAYSELELGVDGLSNLSSMYTRDGLARSPDSPLATPKSDLIPGRLNVDGDGPFDNL
jgi:hypothetical protein